MSPAAQAGTCGVMGTASTMACLLVALGLMPLDSATPAAVSAARLRVAETTGRLALALAQNKTTPQDVLSHASFLNAFTVLQAIGGSTNAAVHLIAVANRHPSVAGSVSLATLDEVGRRTPLLVDLKPSGDGYMTDFHAAGGMTRLLAQLRTAGLLRLEARTVMGPSLGEALDAAAAGRHHAFPQGIIRPLDAPLHPSSSLVVLRGNLAPRGAVIKASASKDTRLLRHTGPAVVFAGTEDLAARIDSPELDVSPDSVLVLTRIGPVGYPGMPEAGLIPIPRKLAALGVQDMLRVSDGRMSGTAGGTVVLHVSPEAADPESVLGVVRDGDLVSCDVRAGVLRVELSDEEIERRLAVKRESLKGVTEEAWRARDTMRGYRGLYLREVNQADEGADFKFLTAAGPGRPGA